MNWRYIIVHHSLTKDGSTVSWGAIRRYHTEVRGWKDIGYHFGIELVGRDFEIFVGRTLDEPGAHTKGHNHEGIGICVVGNFDLVPPHPAAWAKLVKLIKWLMQEYNIPPENVKGHREFAPYKTCPGKRFDLDRLREEVSNA